MITLGRALMARLRLILFDEPSMDLAQRLVEEIFATVTRFNRDDGVTFSLAEQNATRALAVVNYEYVMENGRMRSKGLRQRCARTLTSRFFISGPRR